MKPSINWNGMELARYALTAAANISSDGRPRA